MSSGRDEIKAYMNSSIMISVHRPLDFKFFLQITFILLVNKLDDTISTIEINDKIIMKTNLFSLLI